MSQGKRYICVHGHFYQPPRDNPWLGSIDPQPSAAPYRDWNARILDECYRPNVAARVLDVDGFITRIANNYSRISFNVGPTLMSWLQTDAPEVHEGIVRADRLSRERFAGHGSAMAQAYNHIIMPLANERDLRTQVLWGVADFQHRFKRQPVGMWLPETAANTACLEALAANGIEFTVLAPNQARRVRPVVSDGAEAAWHEVGGGHVDPRRVYKVNLPSGRSLDVFFYDGPASRAVAFERLLANGGTFADRLLSLNEDPGSLAHIATDGETYGHHHRHGEMALAVACAAIEADPGAELTNYGEFRAHYPAHWEAEIHEDTSWSCAHGVRRWNDDCGCNSGGKGDWHQRWRGPLRAALDWLRDELAELYERQAAPLLEDPWAARDDYIAVILDRRKARVDAFLDKHQTHPLGSGERQVALELLELQRNAMLMYTSCGWFFDDIAGTEGVQVLRYAARAIDLASCVGGDVEEPFLRRLALATGNMPEYPDGRVVWEKLVPQSRASLRDVVAHQAVMSLFEGGGSDPVSPEQSRHGSSYCFRTETYDFHERQAGHAKLVTGRMRIVSTITEAEGSFCFGALHLGDHNIMGGVLLDPGPDAYRGIVEDVIAPFEKADLVAAQRAMDRHFHDSAFSLGSLLADERDHIISLILERPVADAGHAYRQIYRRHAPLMSYLAGLEMPIPEVLRATAELVLNRQLRETLDDDAPDLDLLRSGCENARRSNIELDHVRLSYSWQQALERATQRASVAPLGIEELDALAALAALATELGFEVNTWKVQNMCWELLRTTLPTHRRLAAAADGEARRWVESFTRLCEAVTLRVGH